MARSATTPARNSSLFLVGLFRLAARSFKASSTAYSALGMVKLSRTSLCLAFGVAGVGAALPFDGAAELRGVLLARFGWPATEGAVFTAVRAFLAIFGFGIRLTIGFIRYI